MSILHQFMESSIAVTEQIALIMQENTRLKQRVAELELQDCERDLTLNICDLMPIGETFCGLRVICTTNNAFRHAGVDGGDESEWINETTARAIYKAEMELRELRKMVK
jgi:hypothetical protein